MELRFNERMRRAKRNYGLNYSMTKQRLLDPSSNHLLAKCSSAASIVTSGMNLYRPINLKQDYNKKYVLLNKSSNKLRNCYLKKESCNIPPKKLKLKLRPSVYLEELLRKRERSIFGLARPMPKLKLPNKYPLRLTPLQLKANKQRLLSREKVKQEARNLAISRIIVIIINNNRIIALIIFLIDLR